VAKHEDKEDKNQSKQTDTAIAIPKDLEIKDISTEDATKIVKQADEEYNLVKDFNEEKRNSWVKRLKLYNNQKRQPSKVGDPLIFAVTQTVLAALYSDRLLVTFEAKEEGDEAVAENLTGLAEHDYSVMMKDMIDYEWDWDTAFFGRGLLFLYEFDRRVGYMSPVPQVADPMTFLRDSRAASVNGNQQGFEGARFFGREIELTAAEMNTNPAYFNKDDLRKDKDIRNLKEDAKQARREAQGLEHVRDKENVLNENYGHNLLEWWTHYKGVKYVVTLGEARKRLVRLQKIDGERWPLIDRVLFPMSHDWDCVSIPDLTEDKQRGRSVLINLGMDSAKADLYPQYLFDKTRIKNERESMKLYCHITRGIVFPHLQEIHQYIAV